jgi:hypothetical protein
VRVRWLLDANKDLHPLVKNPKARHNKHMAKAFMLTHFVVPIVVTKDAVLYKMKVSHAYRFD